jgi:hypothetical protein
VDARLDAFDALARRTSRLRVPKEKEDALGQLVSYPVFGSLFANTRYFEGERAALAGGRGDLAVASRLAEEAEGSSRVLEAATEEFAKFAGGKWRGFMRLEPADDDWKSMRIAPWKVPTFTKESVAAVEKARGAEPLVAFDAKAFSARKAGRGDVSWNVVPGLGRSANGVTLFPMTAASFDLSKDAASAPVLEYAVEFPAAGNFSVRVHLLPTHALVSGRGLRFGLGVDDAPPQVVTLEIGDGGPAWAQGVLAGERMVTARIEVASAGKKTLRIYGVDAGVVIDRIAILAGDVVSAP